MSSMLEKQWSLQPDDVIGLTQSWQTHLHGHWYHLTYHLLSICDLKLLKRTILISCVVLRVKDAMHLRKVRNLILYCGIWSMGEMCFLNLSNSFLWFVVTYSVYVYTTRDDNLVESSICTHSYFPNYTFLLHTCKRIYYLRWAQSNSVCGAFVVSNDRSLTVVLWLSSNI